MTTRNMATWAIALAIASTSSAAGDRAATAPAGTVETVEQQVRRLLGRMGRGKPERREARDQLIALGSRATAAMITHFESPQFTVRWEIANILGSTRDVAGVPALVDRVLHDSNSHIRWRSLWALGNMKDETIAGRFRAALDDDDATVRWNAAVGGSLFGVRAGLALLQSGVDSKDDFKAWEAVDALGRLPDPSSLDILERVMTSPRLRQRREAAIVLAKLEGPRALTLLVAALDDRDAGVRWRAARSIGTRGGPEVTDKIAACLERETKPEAAKQLRRSLAARGRE